jgi:hypothetical protein
VSSGRGPASSPGGIRRHHSQMMSQLLSALPQQGAYLDLSPAAQASLYR